MLEITESPNALMLEGRFDASQVDKAKTFFSRLNDRTVIDFAKLDYISSAGAGVFIGAIGTAQENDGNIVLMKPSPNVKEVFDLLGLSQIFPFANDVEGAQKLFA